MREGRHAIVGFALMVVTAMMLTVMQVSNTGMLMERRVALDDYMDGTVSRPFAYRVLLPAAFQIIEQVAPQHVSDASDRIGRWIVERGEAVGQWIRHARTIVGVPPASERGTLGSGPDGKYPRAITWLVLAQIASLIGYAAVAASAYSALFPESRWSLPEVALVLLLPLLPIVVRGVGHIYDFSVLFFMACLFRTMLARRHLLYLGVFLLACLNKETAVLMLPVFACVFFDRMPWQKFAALIGAQLLIFLAVYLSVRAAFSGNPGAGIEVQIQDQIAYYRSQGPVFLVCLTATLFAVFYRWRDKPEFCRRAMIIVIPHLALYLFGAAPGELRNWYESLPLLAILIANTAEHLFAKLASLLQRPRAAA